MIFLAIMYTILLQKNLDYVFFYKENFYKKVSLKNPYTLRKR